MSASESVLCGLEGSTCNILNEDTSDAELPDEFAEFLDDSSSFKSKERIQWPFLLWVYLKSLGLYHQPPFVTVRRCRGCLELGHEAFATARSFQQRQCEICGSFLWDHDGEVCYITDEEIGAARLNHRFSFLLSNVWLFLILLATVFLVVIDIINFNHERDDFVDTLSRFCIQGLLTIPPLTAITCNMYTCWPYVAPGQWSEAVSPVYLVQRLRCVNMRRSRAAGYALFFGSIFFITLQCTRLTQDLFAYGHQFTAYTPVDFFSIAVGIFNYAGLVYLVYLLRRSFEKEVSLACKFAKYFIDDIDLCRRRFAEMFDAFHKFREFSSGWMSLNVVLGIVCLLLEVHAWIVATRPMNYFRYERLAFLLACFALPILAVGNVSVDYLWYRMIRQFSRQRRFQKELHWDKILQFLQEQRPGNRPWQSVMAFVLSIIAVFSAIQFRILSSKAVNSATNYRGINITELYDS